MTLYVARVGMAEVQRLARQWLVEQGLIIEGEPRRESLKRMNAYRIGLARTPRPDMKQWARDLVADKRAGVPVPAMHVTLACEALGMDDVGASNRRDG